MDMSVGQHYVIKFCMHLKKNTVKIISLLQEAFGNEVLGISMIKRWHKMSLAGRVGRIQTVGREAENHVQGDKYQYRCNCH